MTDAARPRARRGKRATVVSTAVLGVLALVLTGFALRYMAVKASVGGSDGGANDQTLQVRIDGGDWVDSGTSYSEAHTRGSGEQLTAEARVVTHPLNADGSEATMYSGTVDETGTAKTYVPPQPKSTVVWGPQGTNKSCTSDYCRSVDVRLSNLEPGKEYKLSLYTYPGPDNAGGEWFTNPPYEVVTADENGNFSTVADGWNLMYGFPDNDFNVQVDGKVTSEHSYQPL